MSATISSGRTIGLVCALSVAATMIALPRHSSAAAPDVAGLQRADSVLRELLEREWKEELDRDPTRRLQLGIRGRPEGWTPTTDERDAEDEVRAHRKLAVLAKSIDVTQLSAQGQLEYRVYEQILRTRIRQVEYRKNAYFFTRNTSDPYLEFPQLIISSQPAGSADEAREYIAKLRGLRRVLDEAIAGTQARARRGIVLPAFNFADIAANSRAFVLGRPCDDGPAEHSIWKDFQAKVGRATLRKNEAERLLGEAQSALRDEVCPAYRRFADVFEKMGKDVTSNDGLWSLRDGDKLYRVAIAVHTSMEVDPAELHRTGLREVERIESSIRGFMDRDQYRGTIGDYFATLRADPRYLLPQTTEGRAEYLAAAQQIFDRVTPRLPELFSRVPQRPLVVRPVEPERESSLGNAAFYTAPTGGVGPGVFYVGMADMKRLPLWELEPIAYHEGLPGHHFQVSLAEESTDRSEFRRYYRNAAYQEGWGLYAEGLGTELGGYTDDLSQLARLRLDLLRAVRIVVETGFHHERWDWDRCASYLAEHLGVPPVAAHRDVTRYMVWPGQGVSYKLGELEIRRLRAKAEAALGKSFSARDFHTVILNDGVLPFDVLAAKVEQWLDAQTASRAQGGK